MPNHPTGYEPGNREFMCAKRATYTAVDVQQRTNCDPFRWGKFWGTQSSWQLIITANLVTYGPNSIPPLATIHTSMSIIAIDYDLP